MPPNGGPAKIDIPATVYPGMFKGEVQVSVNIGDQEINIIVSEDDAKYDHSVLSDKGIPGILIADIVSKTDDGFLVHLPGEVQGATNRVELAQSV